MLFLTGFLWRDKETTLCFSYTTFLKMFQPDFLFFLLLTEAGVIVLVIELALSEDSNCPNFAESFCFTFCQILSVEQMLSHQQKHKPTLFGFEIKYGKC